MEPDTNLQLGAVVQIDPRHDDGRGDQWFGGCMLVVTEVKSWGVQGYVQSAGVPGQQHYRCAWEHMEPTGGVAPWQLDRSGEDS